MKPEVAGSPVTVAPHGRKAWQVAIVIGTIVIVAGLAASAVLRPSGGEEPLVVIAAPVAAVPVLDGELEPLWDSARVGAVTLWSGRHGGTVAQDVEMRVLYTPDSVYFAARWAGERPVSSDEAERNKLIVHFDVPAPWSGAEDHMCLTACHTAYVDGQGQGRYITAETIPPGVTDALALGGGWFNGVWTLEWGRPLANGNPYDVQFVDLRADYRFFVKLVESHPDRPDPVSEDIVLRFEEGS